MVQPSLHRGKQETFTELDHGQFRTKLRIDRLKLNRKLYASRVIILYLKKYRHLFEHFISSLFTDIVPKKMVLKIRFTRNSKKYKK